MSNIQQIQQMKVRQQKISMVTCYDHWSAQIIAQTAIDIVLVGDSAAMVMHGHATTIPANMPMMVLHTSAVARGLAEAKLLVADMPFLSYRKDKNATMQAVESLMQAGAHAIKLEGVTGNEEIIQHVVESGVPVMGHIGMTPQSIHQLGGFHVQGKRSEVAEHIVAQARQLEQLGCFSIVLECIPANLAAIITQQLTIPTIGIGAGAAVDGQVLVLHDLLGFNPNFKPKFLKVYGDGFNFVKNALDNFSSEVKANTYPDADHSY